MSAGTGGAGAAAAGGGTDGTRRRREGAGRGWPGAGLGRSAIGCARPSPRSHWLRSRRCCASQPRLPLRVVPVPPVLRPHPSARTGVLPPPYSSPTGVLPPSTPLHTPGCCRLPPPQVSLVRYTAMLPSPPPRILAPSVPHHPHTGVLSPTISTPLKPGWCLSCHTPSRTAPPPPMPGSLPCLRPVAKGRHRPKATGNFPLFGLQFRVAPLTQSMGHWLAPHSYRGGWCPPHPPRTRVALPKGAG